MAKDISKVYLSSDHAGIDLRKAVAAHLQAAGYAVEDLGPEDGMSVDYPDSMAVNRFPWMRAALVGDATAARLCREHNDANVLALGQRLTGRAVAIDCVDTFMATAFEGGRHTARVDKLSSLGDGAGT